MKPLILAALVLSLPGAAGAADDAALRRARRILATTPLIDGHNDLPWEIRDNAKAPHDVAAYDLRARTAGPDRPRAAGRGPGGRRSSGRCTSRASPKEGYARLQLEQIDIARQLIARYPERLALALTADDVMREFKKGKVASLLGMEGGHVLENSLGALRAYYDLGARYMTLTHNVTLDWADTAGGSRETRRPHALRRGGRAGDEPAGDAGRPVPRLGRDDGRRAPRVGGAGDLLPLVRARPHRRAAQRAGRDPGALAAKRRRGDGDLRARLRVEGGLRRLRRPREAHRRAHSRPITDDAEKKRVRKQIEEAEPLPKATLAQVADHIEHVRKVAGADHVGIGSDFDGMGEGPVGLEDVSKYPDLFAELIRRGWTRRRPAEAGGGERAARDAAGGVGLEAAACGPAGLHGNHRVAGRRRGRESELGRFGSSGAISCFARIDAQAHPVAVGIGDVQRRRGALDQRPPGQLEDAHPVLEARPPRRPGRAPIRAVGRSP